MKYRVRLDFFFEGETDARELMGYIKTFSGKAVSINQTGANKEIAFYELEICRHDEGLPCERLERGEIP